MLLHEELTYKVRGCCYKVRNKYGKDHREKIYQKALEEELRLSGISYISQPRVKIYSLTSGEVIGTYIPDFLIENILLLEIKALPFVAKDAERQTREYLKTSKYEIIFLVNFGEKDFNPRRFIYTNDRKPFFMRKPNL